MSTSFVMMKNGVATKVTISGIKTEVMRGNPAGEGAGTGKFSTKVRSTGPVSGD
jgi:hypothetical protein